MAMKQRMKGGPRNTITSLQVAIKDSVSTHPIKPWPTPNVAGGGNMCELTPNKGHFLRPSGQKAHLGLDQAVRMDPWPTPRATESEQRTYKRTPSQEAGRHGLYLQAEVNEAMGPDASPMKLHGRWTLALMGFPDDWCDDLPPDPLTPT
ncbi:MAG TPA: hypothetical protein VNJ04_19530 [Gemmatimonadaceae bacterium]|nr:hypothetical protein [Gemmatimonadaceae bacterium]